jgi:hypothetical protein
MKMHPQSLKKTPKSAKVIKKTDKDDGKQVHQKRLTCA